MNKNTKSPLTDKPLRYPGQSLDEAIDKLLDDEAMKYFLFPGFFTVYAGVEWWRWYANAPYAPILYSVIALIAVLFSVFKLIKIKKRLLKLKLGRDGERAVGQYLESLRENGYRIYHDIIGNRFNIDHVIVCEHGIFTVETKTYSKPIQGQALVRYDGAGITINGNQTIQDILTQARAEANWLRNLLKEMCGKETQVKPIIVFPGWYVDNSSAGFNPDVWVLNPKVLSEFIPKSQMSLSKEDVALFSYNISRYSRTTPPSE